MKYARLWWAFFRASLQADLEYRMNFVTRIVTDVFWYITQIVTFEALFLHRPQLGGWSIEQTRVFLGLLFVTDAIYMILFHDNFEKLNDRVRKGEMDLLLVKPVNSQFMMSCQRMATALIGNLLLALAWLSWSLWNLPGLSPWRVAWLFLFVPAGVLAIYAVRFMVGTTAVMFTRSENIQYLWYQVYRLGMRPDGIYPVWLRWMIVTVLPVGLVASVPARVLFEGPSWQALIVVIATTGAFIWASHRFWSYALRNYTSASS